jgi:hypothetical protein
MGRARTAIVFACAFGLLLATGRARLLRDPGTFWHTVTGERILSAGFPHSDWLSFTFAGRSWVAHQWLGECAMALLHRLGGLDAMVVAAAAALALLLAWLYARLVAGGVAWPWAVVVVALAFLAASQHFHVRPHLASMLLFAAAYARLADVDGGRARLASLAPLPLLFLVWVNAHGGVVGGFATLGLFAAGWTAAWLARWPSPVRTRRDLAGLLALGLACAAIVPLTPYGLGVARAWLAILGSPELARHVVEHGSILRAGGWQVLALGALHVAALAGARRGALRPSSAIPLVWLLLTFDRVRNAPLFAISAAIALADLLPAVRWAGPLARSGIRIAAAPERPPGRVLALGAAAATAAALAAVAVHHRADPAGAPVVARLDPAYWPVGLLPALRAEALDLAPGAPILNDYRLGGFLAYHAPRLRVFVDDRWELYGDAFMLDELRGDPRWLDGWVSREHVTLALADEGSPLQRYLDSAPGWTRVATSPAGSLHRRAVAARAAVR